MLWTKIIGNAKKLGKMFGDICFIGQEDHLSKLDAEAAKVIEQTAFLSPKDYIERYKLTTPTISKVMSY